MTAGVLVVAGTRDPHATSVMAALTTAGATVAIASVSDVGRGDLTVDPGMDVRIAGTTVTAGWTIWWHRRGALPPVHGASPAEQTLARDEAVAILVGGLLALDVRWVDDPAAVDRAEHTVWQIACARAAGAVVPDTVGTDDPSVAASFLARGPTVAKTVSSGTGLAPPVSLVQAGDLDVLAGAPTVLQRLVPAAADIRLVIVGAAVLAWRRKRHPDGSVDWRADDPTGSGFAPCDVPRGVADAALSTASRLGLSTCVQDWVVDGSGCPWFLEVNPVGSWAFLADATETVAPLLAAHLRPAGKANQ